MQPIVSDADFRPERRRPAGRKPGIQAAAAHAPRQGGEQLRFQEKNGSNAEFCKRLSRLSGFLICEHLHPYFWHHISRDFGQTETIYRSLCLNSIGIEGIPVR